MSETQFGDESLQRWLAFLCLSDCPCSYEWKKSLGRLYGISMGPGWVRTTSHPGCPHHNEGRDE